MVENHSTRWCMVGWLPNLLFVWRFLHPSENREFCVNSDHVPYQLSCSPACTIDAVVPSGTRRTARSAMPFAATPCGIDRS